MIERPDDGYSYGGRFTGPVSLGMLLEAQDAGIAGAPDIARVSFADGAVTHWHAHPGGQLLYLLSGAGRVGSETDGQIADLVPDTLVQTAPGERHWHGADAERDAVWLAITWGVTVWEDGDPLAAPD